MALQNTLVYPFEIFEDFEKEEDFYYNPIDVNEYGSYTLKYTHNYSGTHDTKDMFSFLKFNFQITSLNLNGCNLSPEGKVNLGICLRSNTTITELDLTYTGFDNAGFTEIADALKQNSNLKVLSLAHNYLGPTEANLLFDALLINKTLTDLDISFNNIGNSGAFAFAKMIESNTTLFECQLGCNNIESEGAEAIKTALNINKSIVYIALYDGPDFILHNKFLTISTNRTKIFLNKFWSQNNHYNILQHNHYFISRSKINCHEAIMTVMLINNHLPEPIFGYLLDYIFSFLRFSNFN